MKKQRKLREEEIENLQGETDLFVAGSDSSGIGIKIISGVLAGAGLLLLTSCDVESPEYGEYDLYTEEGVSIVRVEKDDFAEKEIQLEKELAAYLSEKTGVNVELIDMREISLVQSSGNYLVVKGLMINDVKVGLKECSVTLSLSDAQFQKMQAGMARYVYFAKTGTGNYGVAANHPEDIIAARYAKSFLSVLSEVVKDGETEIEVIYDAEAAEWLYEKPEPVTPKK